MASTRTPRTRRDRSKAGEAVETYLDETPEVLGELNNPNELLHEASPDGGDLSFAPLGLGLVHALVHLLELASTAHC